MAKGNKNKEESFDLVELNLKNNIKCKTMPLPHPGLNTAFRMYSNDFDFVYASDVEAEKATTIDDIAKFSTNTQYIFIDSSYTDTELKKRVGWGHLSYQQVIDLAKKLKGKIQNLKQIKNHLED